MESNVKLKNIKKVLANIIKVTISNIFILIAGVLTGFVLPKIMGISDYGYYKTFTLYISYSSLFRFGIVDGIYLLYGGKSYGELDKTKFRFYSKFLIILEFVFSITLMVICAFFLKGEYRIIFIFVSIYVWAFNTTSYYQSISQITGRFNELSIRNILQAIFTSIGIITLVALYKYNHLIVTYKLYICFYVCVQLFLSIWYIVTYRDITFGNTQNNSFKEILNFSKIGFPLLFANLCSTLLLTMDRQFVNILFENNDYAIYAFAYNMLSLVTVATSAVSTVIYPMLKKAKDCDLKIMYSSLVTVMLLFVYLALLMYFPLSIFIQFFLPKYVESLKIFKIIFPGLAVSSVITVIMHNYYKVIGKNFLYFIKSFLILGISIMANIIAFLLFKTMVSISFASILVMLIWYMMIERTIIRKYKVAWKKNLAFMNIMIVVFYLSAFCINKEVIGFIVYGVCLAVISIIIFKNDYKKIYMLLKNRGK